MKKRFVYFAALLISAAAFAPQGLSAQQKSHKGIVYVQGHPHELLTAKAKGGKLKTTPARQATKAVGDTIVPPGNLCYVGSLSLVSGQPVDTAYLMVKWTDSTAVSNVDTMLVWGYVWNPNEYVPKTTIDMIRAVANVDCNFNALLQNTGGGNFTVGGFGYNFNENGRVTVKFNGDGAAADPFVKFKYGDLPDCANGQLAAPNDTSGEYADEAIDASENTGIIKHPYDAAYSYPAYDYDYWTANGFNFKWQAGWNNGYWGFFSAENRQVPDSTDYSDYGISTRVLQNNSVDGFVFNFAALYPVSYDMSGNYTIVSPACTSCGACSINSPTRAKETTKKK